MKPEIKSFLTVAAKNAVNAVLTNAGLMAMFSGQFNLHDWHGIFGIMKATALVIASREAAVYLPKLMAWSVSTPEQRIVTAAKQDEIAAVIARPNLPTQ
jgi:hypothetical protein